MTDRLAQLEKLYATDDRDPFLTYGIALEHAKAGQHDEAIRWLDRTLELDADYAYAWFQKGRILDEVGRTDEAKQVLTAGIARARQAGNPDATHAAEEMTGLLESMA